MSERQKTVILVIILLILIGWLLLRDQTARHTLSYLPESPTNEILGT